MMIRLRDAIKLTGVFIISFCAVFVCTLFLNFNMDITRVKDLISDPELLLLYDAQKAMAGLTSAVSGGCLLLTSVVMLFFYIRHYIDAHKKELGILKALGYSDLAVAASFLVFGAGVFLGTAAGYLSAHALMPVFYQVMNRDAFLPDISMHVNPVLAVYLVILPSLLFALLSIAYSYHKLKRPALELLREQNKMVRVKKKKRIKAVKTKKETSFLQELKSSTVKRRISLVFFVAFASFCFAAMMQMTVTMDEIASQLFAVIIFIIGIVLSCTTLLLAIEAVVSSDKKTIAMMRVSGYTQKECSQSILSGYRPIAYTGFAVGTIYQYGLMKLMLSLFEKSTDYLPEYQFDIQAFFIVLFAFAIIYELVMYYYTRRIGQVSVKEIMLD